MQATSSKSPSSLAAEYIRELESEVRATRECLQAIAMDKPDWKPHDKSMALGYMAILVADIPRWIEYAIDKGEVDFATYPQAKATTADELVAHFDKAVEGAKRALGEVTDERLKETFYLKNDGQELMKAPIDETVMSSINHMVHHRGQLTVYMRLLDIAVPSIYGPSADSRGF
jgi:uncharacterized damage-inducible protein DinB